MHLDALKSAVAALRAEPSKLYRVVTNEDIERQLFTITIVSINAIELVRVGLPLAISFATSAPLSITLLGHSPRLARKGLPRKRASRSSAR